MMDVNPFCDSDIRNGLQFLSGVNLIITVICIVVDALAIAEIEEFSETWNTSSFYLPVYIGIILLCCDILLNLLMLLCGWATYSSVNRKTYGKINKLFYPCLVLFVIELGVMITYLVCIPSSPFFYYFVLLTYLYKTYFFWPMKKFINEHSHHQLPRTRILPVASERTRLLSSA